MKTRRPLKFDNLQHALEEVQRLRAGGYTKGGNWSLAQVVDHLNKSMLMATEGPPFLLPAPIRPVLRWIIYPKMKRGQAIRIKANAPRSLRPGDDPDLDESIGRFESLVQEISDPDARLAPLHPLVGKVSAEQWHVISSWHAAHHLSFLLPVTGGQDA